jgi:hypothetical protein
LRASHKVSISIQNLKKFKLRKKLDKIYSKAVEIEVKACRSCLCGNLGLKMER